MHRPPPPAAPSPTRLSALPGLLVCGVLAAIAWPLGAAYPLVGAPVMGMLIGLAVGNLITVPGSWSPGIQFSVKRLLKWAIIGLGLKLPLLQLWQVGGASLKITLVTLALAFVVAIWVGRWLKVEKKLALLIGTGTAICGGSAIAAVAPVLQPRQQDLALSLTTIFMFNLVAVFIFPLFGHLLGLDEHAFGVWAGTAINDTSSVVAAAYSYGHEAGDTATIVKLTRAAMILPVTLMMAFVYRQKTPTDAPQGRALSDAFPWFILGFVFAALIHTLGVLPSPVEDALIAAADFMLVMALVAVGLNSPLKRLLSAGPRPVLLGLIVWASVALSSLAIMRLDKLWG